MENKKYKAQNKSGNKDGSEKEKSCISVSSITEPNPNLAKESAPIAKDSLSPSANPAMPQNLATQFPKITSQQNQNISNNILTSESDNCQKLAFVRFIFPMPVVGRIKSSQDFSQEQYDMTLSSGIFTVNSKSGDRVSFQASISSAVYWMPITREDNDSNE